MNLLYSETIKFTFLFNAISDIIQETVNKKTEMKIKLPILHFLNPATDTSDSYKFCKIKNILLRLFMYFIIMIISDSVYSQSGWYQQQSNVTVDLNKIVFVNSNTGWITGDSGVILKTTDKGSEWIRQTSNVNSILRSAYFLNENTGYIVGGNYTPLTFSFIVILKTTNGGTNWNTVYNFPEFYNSTSDVSFINPNTGYVICFGGNESESVGLIFKTTNAGSNWFKTEYNKSLSTINFTSEFSGWIFSNYYSDVLSDSAIILKTDNSGSNWKSVYNIEHSQFTSSHFFNLNTGWAAARTIGNAFILKTTNGGSNWENTYISSFFPIRSIYFPGEDTGWYCTSGIYRSTNGGSEWINQIPPDGFEKFNSIYFTDNSTGWTVGNNGIILHTFTGGILSTENTGEVIPNKYSLSQNYPNPFNPSTNLEFGISELGFVCLKVFDISGKEVATLVNEVLAPGKYNYQFSTVNYQLSSGVYFYRLESGSFVETKRMVLLK